MRSPGHGVATQFFAEPVAARRDMVQITSTMRTRSITSSQTVVRLFVIWVGAKIMGGRFVSYLRVSTDRQVRWRALSGQVFALDKWNLCRLPSWVAVFGVACREGVARPE